MAKIIVLLLLLVSAVYCKEYTPVQQCGSGKLFKNVAVHTNNGLCKKLPCQFKLGETLKVDIEFENKGLVETIRSECVAKVLGSDVEFPIPDANNGCKYLTTGKCPLQPNSSSEITIYVPVKPPSVMNDEIEKRFDMDVKLKFSLNDQKNDLISCFQLTTKVAIA